MIYLAGGDRLHAKHPCKTPRNHLVYADEMEYDVRGYLAYNQNGLWTPVMRVHAPILTYEMKITFTTSPHEIPTMESIMDVINKGERAVVKTELRLVDR